MPIYDVPFTITGRVPGIEADSAEEAKAKVDAIYDEVMLADKFGVLETHDGERPRTREEYRRQTDMEAIFKEASLG